MEFLKKFNISEECIRDMKEIYAEEVLYNFELNEKNVSKNILYLKKKGIIDIESLLIQNIDLFIKNPSKVEEVFETHPSYIEEIKQGILDWDYLF